MDVYDYTIDDLIVKCSEKMKESGYSQRYCKMEITCKAISQ